MLSVSTSKTDWNRELLWRLCGYSDLIDAEVRIWADDGSSTEVYTLSRKVTSEASLLTLQTLCQRLQWATGAVSCRRNSAGLVVEVGGAVVL